MFDAQAFIDSTRQRIENLRRKASYFRMAGYALTVVGPVLLITGAIEGFALSLDRNNPMRFVNIFPRIGVAAWLWLDQHIPTLWAVLRAISPYPRMTPPLPFVSLIGWSIWGFGILWLGRALLKRADTLKKDAAEAQHALDL